ncbi:MAG: hypothetical protein ACK47B_05445 [Armatimonadota bacterium]
MNAEAKVLQAIDAAQQAFRQIRGVEGEERGEIAQQALQQVATAPWSMVARPNEADRHGWLGELREALQRIAQEPETDDLDRLIDSGLWAADELERDIRTLVGAR